MFTKNENNNIGRLGTAKISTSSSVTTGIYVLGDRDSQQQKPRIIFQTFFLAATTSYTCSLVHAALQKVIIETQISIKKLASSLNVSSALI
jgi:hypothetical protein